MTIKAVAKLTAYLLFFVMGVWLWEKLATQNPAHVASIPAPSRILATFCNHFDEISLHAQSTLEKILLAFLVSCLVSVPLVLAMMRSSSVRGAVQLFFILFQTFPAFCLAPLLILWLESGFLVVIIPTILMVLFPLTMSIYKGLTTTPTHLLEYFRHRKATTLQIFFKLQLPHALPYFFSGLRIALAGAGFSAIAGEWSGGALQGLGVLIDKSRQAQHYEMTFAALFTLLFLTLLFYLLGAFLEKKYSFWKAN